MYLLHMPTENDRYGLVCKRYLIHPITLLYYVASILTPPLSVSSLAPGSVGILVGLQSSIYQTGSVLS
jgi:hypothetical protein